MVVLRPALDRIAADIDREFDRLLPVPDDARAKLYEAMRYATIGGGKRLRPLLVIAASALFHVDDAVHKAFDEATAVLAGDALHALAFELLADEATLVDPFVRAELVSELARASGPEGMAGGQMMDLEAEHATFDLQTVTRLQQMKTGALIGFCLEAGAIMGRIPPEGRAPLRGYARDVGLAFQIADDILDVEGDEAAAGKALHKDEAAGKATFLSLLGLDRARAQAGALVDQAIAHLSGFGAEADLLRAIARYTVERDR